MLSLGAPGRLLLHHPPTRLPRPTDTQASISISGDPEKQDCLSSNRLKSKKGFYRAGVRNNQRQNIWLRFPNLNHQHEPLEGT